jgi:hypothetical protein
MNEIPPLAQAIIAVLAFVVGGAAKTPAAAAAGPLALLPLGGAYLLAQVDAVPISGESAISIALVLAVVGGVAGLTWRLSAISTKLDLLQNLPAKVETLNDRVNALVDMPSEVKRLSKEVRTLEADVNNLWSAYREDPHGRTRRERGRESEPDRTPPRMKGSGG